jgi:hypothetical protein
MKREQIQDLSTLKALNKAFTEECLSQLPACTVYQEVQHKDHLPYGASVIYVSEIPVPAMPAAKAKKIGLKDKTIQGMIWLESDINPNGVTCKEDKARTYTIHVEFKGTRKYTQRKWEHGTFIKYYAYALTIEQAIKEFKCWLKYSFQPFQQAIETGTYNWKNKY